MGRRRGVARASASELASFSCPKLGDRYTSYKPTRGGTLTIVNLTTFSKWLSEQVREKEWLDARVLQRSANTRSTRQASKRTRTHKSRALEDA